MSIQLAGSPGPHVFVESLDQLEVEAADMDHLQKSLRMRDGDALTASDGQGAWRFVEFSSTGTLKPTGEIVTVPAAQRPRTVAFS